MLNARKLILLGILFLGLKTIAQISETDYMRADSAIILNKLVYQTASEIRFIEKTPYLIYKVKQKAGDSYVLVDTRKKTRQTAFDEEKVLKALETLNGKKPVVRDLSEVSLSNDLKTLNFVLNDHQWELSLKTYKLIDKGACQHTEEPYWGIAPPDPTDAKIYSPDSNYMAYIKNYNLYVTSVKEGKEFQLSFDGSEGEYYSSNMVWSADSKKIALNHVRANVKRYIHFVQSSPENQLQPILQTREYLKPGDALPLNRPTLFNVAEKKQIAINTEPYENQFSLDNLKWYDDSRGFTFEYNQRGHQEYKIVEVNAISGKTRDIIDEKSPTFIDYAGKHFRFDFNNGAEFIWMSERDGWNHLFLIDGLTGNVKNTITSGDWVVREVVHVDTVKREVIFAGSGMNQDEDPYFIHYYKVKFDGSNLVDLTPEKLNHQAVFSPDFSVFADTYSTVQKAPVTVLRDATTGNVIMELEKADISDLMAHGYILPEPFVAKSRDGKTDIWGNIYRPTNFDASKKYPVIEYIYAGPQSSYVQKSFRPYFYSFSGLAELGFIIVTIDGMGTSDRSKAFHDVCYKNIKDAGFPDRILWMQAAAQKYPYMDISRVGVFGGSAGGQNSTAALLFHPEFYKVGVSSCGCHDNRMDKMWWNELWMGYPIGKEYEECSNVVNAYRLQGHLMLIVGEMDDNVDPSSTMQMANALMKAKKDFELVVLPGMNHTLGGDYGEFKRRDFFVKHLLNSSTPEWNCIKK